jgi:hypothetical protein
MKSTSKTITATLLNTLIDTPLNKLMMHLGCVTSWFYDQPWSVTRFKMIHLEAVFVFFKSFKKKLFKFFYIKLVMHLGCVTSWFYDQPWCVTRFKTIHLEAVFVFFKVFLKKLFKFFYIFLNYFNVLILKIILKK